MNRVARLGASLALAALLSGCGDRPTTISFASFDPDSIPEAYARSTASLAWPGATRAFQITDGGDLYNGEWRTRFTPTADGAEASPPRVIAFERRWIPVARWIRNSGSVRWEFEAVAWPERDPESQAPDAPLDSTLLASVAVRATNHGDHASTASLGITLQSGDSSAPFVAWDAPESSASYRWGARGSRGIAHGLCAGSDTGRAIRVDWRLEPGSSRSERFVIPAYPEPVATLERWARVPHADRVASARRAWNAMIDRGARFELGDPEVEDALRAAVAVLLACRERRGSIWFPIGGPLHYRDVWLRDGARAVFALSVTGHTDEARALAQGLSGFQWPQGPFVSQRGQLDGTGQALWSFDQAFLRPPAAPEIIAPYADQAERAWRWCERQRALGRSTGWEFGEMLPAANPRDNENVRAQLTGNDAWAIAGYASAARLMRAAKRPADADSVTATLERYRSDFARELARIHARDVPPSWQRIGRDWGNLSVAWPCAVLSPSDARCAALADRVWSAAGGVGLGAYGHADSLHYYVGADLGTWALLVGRRADADRVLAAMLRWRSASGGAGELFSRSTRDYGKNPPPHATSAAALITLVRNGLIFDDGDTLRLTMGARESWWRGARISGAPTRWGALDLTFRRERDDAEWTWTAVPVWTALTLPPRARLAVAPPAPLVRGPREDVILVPPGTGRARVRVSIPPLTP